VGTNAPLMLCMELV